MNYNQTEREAASIASDTVDNRSHNLLTYAGILVDAGLDTKQNYYRFSRVCKRIEQVLDIKED